MRKEGRRSHANWSEAAQMVILIPVWICAIANASFFLLLLLFLLLFLLLDLFRIEPRQIAHRW